MTLKDLIEQRLLAQDWHQKQLAGEWHTRVGAGEHSTYVSRLSNLANDEDAGYEFVLEGKQATARLDALAALLEVTPSRLRGICETARTRVTLVLDPRLRAEERTFLLTRAESSAGTFSCAEVSASPSGIARGDALKELALKSRNAVVVVPDDEDREFFRGAGLTTSRLEAARPGYRLVALPELMPPLPLRLQDSDGMPMIPALSVEDGYRKRMSDAASKVATPLDEREQAWADRIHAADAEGTPVTFRLDDLLRAWWHRIPDATTLQEIAVEQATAGLVPAHPGGREALTPNFVWIRDNRVLALCGHQDSVRAAVARHHPVNDITTFEPLVSAIRRAAERRNPYCAGGVVDLSDPLRAFAAETGLTLEIDVASLRGVLERGAERGEFDAGAPTRMCADTDRRARALLDDLLAREFLLQDKDAGLLFELDLIRRAPLVHVAGKDSTLSAFANIGAGHVLRIDITEFPAEEPSPVRRWKARSSVDSKTILDGGNVRLQIVASRYPNRNLEGTVLRSVLRRRAEEQAKRADDDYDDD